MGETLPAPIAPKSPAPEGTVSGISGYLREIASVPLLGASEEIRLSETVRRGRRAADALAQRDWSAGSVDELWERVLAGRVAERTMARANLRLVVSVAKGYLHLGMPLDDLIQEGNLGLLRAIPRFDPAHSCRFSTYAVYWIRQAIGRAVGEHAGCIRVPAHVAERVSRVRRARAQLHQSLGRDPTFDELVLEAARLDPDERSAVREALDAGHVLPADLARRWESAQTRVRLALRMCSDPMSLHDTGADGDGRSVEDMLPCDERYSPSALVGARLLKHALQESLQLLTPRERQVLMHRFGLGGAEVKTLAQLGREYGVSRERVRQIQNKALEKLRAAPRECSLRGFVG